MSKVERREFPKLPEWYIKPELNVTHLDGNAFVILGTVEQAIKKKGREEGNYEPYSKQATDFRQCAMSKDYDKLLRAMHHWVEVVVR